jgi:hypothetical protein
MVDEVPFVNIIEGEPEPGHFRLPIARLQCPAERTNRRVRKIIHDPLLPQFRNDSVLVKVELALQE